MKGIQPSIVVLLRIAVALSNPERCCERKTVGDKSYTLVESGGEVPLGCKSSCVYTEDDDPNKMFCFAPGYMSVTCQDSDCQLENTYLKDNLGRPIKDGP